MRKYEKYIHYMHGRSKMSVVQKNYTKTKKTSEQSEWQAILKKEINTFYISLDFFSKTYFGINVDNAAMVNVSIAEPRFINM